MSYVYLLYVEQVDEKYMYCDNDGTRFVDTLEKAQEISYTFPCSNCVLSIFKVKMNKCYFIASSDIGELVEEELVSDDRIVHGTNDDEFREFLFKQAINDKKYANDEEFPQAFRHLEPSVRGEGSKAKEDEG